METQVLLPKETEMDAEQPQNTINTTVDVYSSVAFTKTLETIFFI